MPTPNSSNSGDCGRVGGGRIHFLDKQAKALGLGRSTAWTIIKKKHNLGRLNAKTTQSILANPDTPASVRALIQQYVAQDLVTLPESIE
jgi:hypothetical protein